VSQFLAFWGGVLFAIGALGVDLNDGTARTPWGTVVIESKDGTTAPQSATHSAKSDHGKG
jgi:hypothetical protein